MLIVEEGEGTYKEGNLDAMDGGEMDLFDDLRGHTVGLFVRIGDRNAELMDQIDGLVGQIDAW